MQNTKVTGIERGKTEFLMGISDPIQLDEFCKTHPGIIGVAFVGRSNVGKSSTINALFGNKTARVSNTPGRTREVNIFSFQLQNPEPGINNQYYLFDLPGYGHAEISKQMAKNWDTLMAVFFYHLSEKIALFNIQDARHPDTEVDREFHGFLKQYPNETFLIFNKIDKLKKQSERAELKKLMPKIYDRYAWVRQIHMISAETLTGVDALQLALVNYLLKKDF